MSQGSEQTGRCLCGKVTFTIAQPVKHVAVCHCSMCQRWTGGPMMALHCDGPVSFEGEEHVRRFRSSDWAERGFCEACGSAMFYRITADGPMKGATTVAFGTLDDQAGFAIVREWYIDLKPDAYTLEGEREGLTEAQINAMFSMG